MTTRVRSPIYAIRFTKLENLTFSFVFTLLSLNIVLICVQWNLSVRVFGCLVCMQMCKRKQLFKIFSRLLSKSWKSSLLQLRCSSPLELHSLSKNAFRENQMSQQFIPSPSNPLWVRYHTHISLSKTFSMLILRMSTYKRVFRILFYTPVTIVRGH